MDDRRKFLSQSFWASLALGALSLGHTSCSDETQKNRTNKEKGEADFLGPLVMSTWNFGEQANKPAYDILEKGGTALDAVEQGVRAIESDPENTTVGIGGAPDREGRVTLDACIMDEKGNAGSVTCLEHIENPVSVARKIMEDTPHVILTAEGALDFALSKGFKKTNLLTEKSKENYENWLKESKYKPIINIENHDTIGMIALDKKGNLSAACTTSGLAYKMKGRVGDSPIIGAGLFVDNEVGAAAATGLGEAVLKTLGSFLVVELMRGGMTPNEACKEAVNRIVQKMDVQDFQVAYIAVNKQGEVGSYAIHPGFNFAIQRPEGNDLVDVASYTKK